MKGKARKKIISILFFPIEPYPSMRVRLTELYMKEFTRLGNKIYWIFLSREKNRKTEEIREGENIIFKVPSLGTYNKICRFLNILFVISKYRIAKSQIETGNVDIIIVNDGIVDGFIGYILSKKYKKPFIYYLSSLFFDMSKHRFKEDLSIQTFIKYVLGIVQKYLYLFLIRKSKIFHPISSMMAEYYKPYLNNKIILPLPLCPSKSFSASYRPITFTNDSCSLIYVGQIASIRRIDFLIEIVKKIKDTEPLLPVRLLLVGPIFDASYKEKLNKKIKQFGLEKSVIIMGEVPVSNVPSFISSSNIGLSLLPPILAYKVSSPTKVVEYLSLGIPVIGNKEIKDQKEVIEMSGGGFATDYDITEVAEKIIYLLKNKNKIIEMGEKGRHWIQRNRTYTRMAFELQNGYQKLIHQHMSV